MKLNELNPKPEPAWRARLREFWSQADQRQQLDMQYYLKLGDRAAAQQLLESWDRPVLERRRKKKKAAPRSRFKYGQFGGWFYPGYNFGDGGDGGGDGGGGESLREEVQDIADIIQRFTTSCVDYLGIENAPRIQLRRDPEWTRRNGTFGRYTAEPHRQIELATSGRHIVDILRTLAHEMTHALQDEQTGLPVTAGETGSPFEDEANAMAGRIMRHWAEREPEMFSGVELEEDLRKKLGGAALAAACAVGAPGCATTGDLVRGAQIAGRTAQTMQGHNIRDIARAEAEQELINYLRARRGDANAQNLSRIYQAQRRRPEQVVPEDYDPNGKPPGPESKPTMPAGTVKVDVSDAYDWYKLGQHISDLDGLGKHDFGAGPPSAIISFGDENTEHKYIQGLEKTGLTTTDIDPVDPKQPKGMKRQKTDPTYNVAESSGYIPTAAQKNDPRYSMALTADIRPGEINRQAKKMGWATDTLGRPPVLKTNGQPK